MPEYQMRPGADAYGYSVGILMLDARQPFVPGDVGNATSYDYPVMFKLYRARTLRGSCVAIRN